MSGKIPKVSDVSQLLDSFSLPPTSFKQATLWSKFAFCQTMVGFIMLLFSLMYMTGRDVEYGGLVSEILFLIAFFSYLAAVAFVLVLVYVPEAKDNRLIEVTLMVLEFLAALTMAIAISVWGADVANDSKHSFNMVPVAISVSSAVMALLAGIFTGLELFNVGR